jgi:hypothetical protein
MRRLLLASTLSALIAAGCSPGGGGDAAPTSAAPTKPDLSATPTVQPSAAQVIDADAYETRWPIKHVVFLIKENRTFDNLFGRFPGANGVTVGMDHGQPRPLTKGTQGRVPGDIPHCYPCSLLAWNHGRMDGFDQGENGDWAYTQLRAKQLPN